MILTFQFSAVSNHLSENVWDSESSSFQATEFIENGLESLLLNNFELLDFGHQVLETLFVRSESSTVKDINFLKECIVNEWWCLDNINGETGSVSINFWSLFNNGTWDVAAELEVGEREIVNSLSSVVINPLLDVAAVTVEAFD